MYGLIHCCLEDLVVKLFGEETWNEILKKSGVKLKGASFLMHTVYTDELTFKLISTTSEVVGLDMETCLEAFGNHFYVYAKKNGYDPLLRALGSNLADFLTNLDNMHDHLSTIYPGIRAPSFRVTDAVGGVFHLHYYSERKGLNAIVRGLVNAASKDLFNTEINVTALPECDDGHVILEVQIKGPDAASKINRLIPSIDPTLSTSPKDLLFNTKTICKTFPFHMMFQKDFNIIQIGKSLLRLTRPLWRSNGKVRVNEIFTLRRPVLDFTFESILNYCNQMFVLQSNEQFNSIIQRVKIMGENTPKQSKHEDVSLRLKGQMVPVPESDAILFLCSPRVGGLDEIGKLGLYLNDFPIHDRARDLMLISHQRRGERELIEKLEQATNHIKMLDNKLRDENKRTEEILHNIFPAKIARLLCQNITVEAESFDPITCLYSDIVGFTSMCGTIEPIDIVRLLNKLYLQFDNLSNVYGVYKIETIGDAYVVVGGVPEYVNDHADRVVEMGLAMVKVTHTIISPIDGHSIQMRIGIHSGSCMAGIVGLQQPKFCLIGNTVTLANKMESNSIPGHVHISEETRRYLINDSYHFQEKSQNVFAFSTYFVSKIEDSRTDENLEVQNNSSLLGGHFVSPSGSPSHITRNDSSQTISSMVSPSASPKLKGTQKRKYNNHNDNGTKVQEWDEIPGVRVCEPTPKHHFNSDFQILSEISQNLNVPQSEWTETNKYTKNYNKDMIKGSSSRSASRNSNDAVTKISKSDGQSQNKFFLLFCCGSKKQNHIRIKVKPKQDMVMNMKVNGTGNNLSNDDDEFYKQWNNSDDPRGSKSKGQQKRGCFSFLFHKNI